MNKLFSAIARWNFCFIMQILMAVIAITLLIISFFLPPKGVIDPSVLEAACIFFAFASLFFAREVVRKGKNAKISHGPTSLEISDKDGEQPTV